MVAILQVIVALTLIALFAMVIFHPCHGARTLLIGITIALFVTIGCIVWRWIKDSLR